MWIIKLAIIYKGEVKQLKINTMECYVITGIPYKGNTYFYIEQTLCIDTLLDSIDNEMMWCSSIPNFAITAFNRFENNQENNHQWFIDKIFPQILRQEIYILT